jgi:hypothetical protein
MGLAASTFADFELSRDLPLQLQGRDQQSIAEALKPEYHHFSGGHDYVRH